MSDYNGWTNYETWNVSLWLDNDEGNYLAMRELADQYVMNLHSLADAIKDYVENLPECVAVQETASFVSDLLSHSLGNVNWQEIAASLLDD